MHRYKAILQIIGVNPFVDVPQQIVKSVFQKAGKDRGPIPVYGEINGLGYHQTLVRFRGAWRLYINARMLKNSPKRIRELIQISLEFDSEDRTIKVHPALLKALAKNVLAKKSFNLLTPSRQNEINRYLHHIKSVESVDKNVAKVINHLQGKSRLPAEKS